MVLFTMVFWCLQSNGISKFRRQITHFSLTVCTLGLFGIVVIGQVGMKNKPKFCMSCQKETKLVRHGHCYKCLAVYVVKDWLNMVGSDRQ